MGQSILQTALGIDYPIIQAPMAGVTTPEFVAASSNAGVLGSIGAGYLSGDETREFIRKVKKRTNKPFSVNLFVTSKTEMNRLYLREAYEALQPIGKKLGKPYWKAPLSEPDFDNQIQAVIEEGVSVCSFTFGLPDGEVIQRLKSHGIFCIGTATTAEEAKLAEQVGMDAIVAQGSEAGGHRGSFLEDSKLYSLNELLPPVVASVQIPVIAAGGIATKERMTQFLSNGAQAVQIGTALLATDESGAHPSYKKAVLSAYEGSTVLTTVFSGKSARGIRNQFIDEMKDAIIAPYPYQNDITKELRKEAASQGNSEFMSLWAGESVHLTQADSLKNVLKQFQ